VWVVLQLITVVVKFRIMNNDIARSYTSVAFKNSILAIHELAVDHRQVIRLVANTGSVSSIRIGNLRSVKHNVFQVCIITGAGSFKNKYSFAVRYIAIVLHDSPVNSCSETDEP